MIGIEVDDSLLSSWADLLGYKVERWPMAYLGMPLGGNLRSPVFLDPCYGMTPKEDGGVEEALYLFGMEDHVDKGGYAKHHCLLYVTF